MFAKNNAFMKEAVESLYQMKEDEDIRQRCLERKDYYRTQADYQKAIDVLTTENARLSKENKGLSRKVETLSTVNESLMIELEHARRLLAQNGIKESI
ncbi:MAG: hypothetical protein IJ711_13520 [Lachnospiraceae bacterium]|nr:hypothetical protein [Lachnospiraceae bacterium]